jgi:hypothetical protein
VISKREDPEEVVPELVVFFAAYVRVEELLPSAKL